jgi:hypothetical protein
MALIESFNQEGSAAAVETEIETTSEVGTNKGSSTNAVDRTSELTVQSIEQL